MLARLKVPRFSWSHYFSSFNADQMLNRTFDPWFHILICSSFFKHTWLSYSDVSLIIVKEGKLIYVSASSFLLDHQYLYFEVL